MTMSAAAPPPRTNLCPSWPDSIFEDSGQDNAQYDAITAYAYEGRYGLCDVGAPDSRNLNPDCYDRTLIELVVNAAGTTVTLKAGGSFPLCTRGEGEIGQGYTSKATDTETSLRKEGVFTKDGYAALIRAVGYAVEKPFTYQTVAGGVATTTLNKQYPEWLKAMAQDIQVLLANELAAKYVWEEETCDMKGENISFHPQPANVGVTEKNSRLGAGMGKMSVVEWRRCLLAGAKNSSEQIENDLTTSGVDCVIATNPILAPPAVDAGNLVIKVPVSAIYFFRKVRWCPPCP